MGQSIHLGDLTEPFIFQLTKSADHVSPLSGLDGVTPGSISVLLRKNGGGGFQVPAGAIFEIGGGNWGIQPASLDRNTYGPLILHASHALSDPFDDLHDIGPDGIRSVPQGNTTEDIPFLMISSIDHITGVPGLLGGLNAQISKNGQPYIPPSGTLSDLGFGWYAIAPNPFDAQLLGALLVQATHGSADQADERFEVIPSSQAFLTASDLLHMMAALDNELDIAQGGDDEANALTALSMAQHYLDAVAATMPHVFQTTVQIATAPDEESTRISSLGLLRVDDIWRLDQDGGRQVFRLSPIRATGGHAPTFPYPLSLTILPSGNGAPSGYYITKERVYWGPRPDGPYFHRVWGMQRAAPFTNRATPFTRSAELGPALATFANTVLSIGVADTTTDLMSLANTLFRPGLRAERRVDRTGPMGRHFTMVHEA